MHTRRTWLGPTGIIFGCLIALLTACRTEGDQERSSDTQLPVPAVKDLAAKYFGEDGQPVPARITKQGTVIYVGKPIARKVQASLENRALNISRKGYPQPCSSLKLKSDSSLYQAIDGRIWYFPEITNYWSTAGSTSGGDWFSLDFGKDWSLSTIKLYLVSDGKNFAVPDSISVEYQERGEWKRAQVIATSRALVPNTGNVISFTPVQPVTFAYSFIILH